MTPYQKIRSKAFIAAYCANIRAGIGHSSALRNAEEIAMKAEKV